MATGRLRLLETGLAYRRGFPGLVPELEEREAARFNGYSWREWSELPRAERVDSLAYYRIKRQLEMHQTDAQQREQERQARAAQAQGRR